MAENGTSKTRTLDPVVVEALKSISKRVYHRRGPRLQDQFRRHFSMLDRHSRDYAIAVFNYLRNGGFDWGNLALKVFANKHRLNSRANP